MQIDTSSSGLWQVGVPQKGLSFDSAHSLNNVIITDTVNTYPISNHSYFDVKFEAQLSFQGLLNTNNILKS